MKLLLLGLLAAVSARGGEFVPFRLYMDFQNEPSQQIRESIQEEADTIVSPTGWTFTWRPLSGAKGEVSVRLAVLRFTGTCNAQNLTNPPPFQLKLGATQTDNGIIQPFADIYCDAIRAMLAFELSRVDRSQRDTLFGRAVGRVVAHELYHIFGNTREHAAIGVGESSYSVRDLLADHFRLQDHEVQVLRARLLPVLLEFNDWLQGATPRRGYSVFLKSGCNGCHGLRGEGTRWGPRLQEAGRLYSSAKLSALLKSDVSGMYHRARNLNLMWPRLGTADVEELAWFLESLFAEGLSRAN